MAALKFKCAECDFVFSLSTEGSGPVTCPICNAFVGNQGTPRPGPGPGTGERKAKPVERLPAQPVPNRAANPLPVVTPRRRKVVKILAAGAAVYLIAGLALVIYIFRADTRPETPSQPTSHPQPPSSSLERPSFPTAPQQEKANQAIDRGVVYLKDKLQALNEDRIRTPIYQEGLISLLGWTLLECGVASDDPIVHKSAELLRRPGSQLRKTYSLALAILFLDRLGIATDRTLIQTWALRLTAGQNTQGAWTYDCPILSEQEETSLLDSLKNRSTGELSLSGDTPAKPVRSGKIRRGLSGGDNSNTQFAVLALWVAQRQGIPVQSVLADVDRFFRESQNPEGSWGYVPHSSQWRASMTCAGLLALAVGRSLGSKTGTAQLIRDPAIENGFRYLGQTIGTSRQPGRGSSRIIGADARGDLYYFWSLERVAMIYDLQTIAGQDWYTWATQAIIPVQRPDGSWPDSYLDQCAVVDTCFALLVLKKVNVAKDLTNTVKKVLDVKVLEKEMALPASGDKPGTP